jgi:hypothetical protein
MDGDRHGVDVIAAAYFEALSTGDEEALVRVLAPDFRRRTEGVADVDGIEAMLAYMLSVRGRMRDLKIAVEDVVATERRAAVYWRASYVRGEERIAWAGVSLLSVDEAERVREERLVGDRLAMFEQLGYTLIRPE